MTNPISIALITEANPAHAPTLARLAALTFTESHGSSASASDIEAYVAKHYTATVFEKELQDPDNLYHLYYDQDRLAGFSKIILNTPYAGGTQPNIAKLERLYFLEGFYDKGLGAKLFDFNIDLAKAAAQAGLWLYVWKGNERALRFYNKRGFKVVGHYDFKISETHANPNYQMFLGF